MAVEMLVGLHVVDDESYQSYREEMTPILLTYGGGFGYDFKVSKVFRSRTPAPINRVFTIYFPDEDAMDAFFAHDDYLKVKDTYFEKSVTATTIIATYQREEKTFVIP